MQTLYRMTYPERMKHLGPHPRDPDLDKVKHGVAVLESLEAADQYGSAEYKETCLQILRGLGATGVETLLQLLYKGPVYDGDILSKSHRDMLLIYGLAVRCCFNGEQGYAAASYLGYTVLLHAQEAKSFKEGK